MEKEDVLELVDKYSEIPAFWEIGKRIASWDFDSERVVILLFDGLGGIDLKLDEFRKQRFRAPFPSSTPTFFYSLWSGLPPGEHGYVEWFMRYKDKIITVPPWRDLDDNPVNASYEEVFPFESISEKALKKGKSSALVTCYPDTLFTLASSKGTDKIKAENIEEFLNIDFTGYDLYILYSASPDDFLHGDNDRNRLLSFMDRARIVVEKIWGLLPADTKLIVGSDHGLVKASNRIRLEPASSMPVGGSRVAFYQDIDEAELEKFGIPFDVDEFKPLMGKPSHRLVSQYGDEMVLANGYFDFPYRETNDKAFHGGLSKEEMIVNVWERTK